MKSEIPVVLATDERYAPHTAVTMLSAVRHSSSPLHFYIFSFTPLSQQCRIRLRVIVGNFGSVSFCVVSIDRAQEFVETRHTLATYLRLFIPDVLSDLDQVLYLDSDIVVQSDLSTLYPMDLSGYTLAACQDCSDRLGSLLKHKRNFEIKETSRYFNGGVLVMNLREMRNAGLEAQTLQIMRRFGAFIRFADQDVLNKALEGKILFLNRRWNHFPGDPIAPRITFWTQLFSRSRRRPAVVHYLSDKPWDLSAKVRLRYLYWFYHLQTPFWFQFGQPARLVLVGLAVRCFWTPTADFVRRLVYKVRRLSGRLSGLSPTI